MNPLHPRHMSPAERRSEFCRILALGVLRLGMRKSSGVLGADRESSLHLPRQQSGHATPTHEEDA